MFDLSSLAAPRPRSKLVAIALVELQHGAAVGGLVVAPDGEPMKRDGVLRTALGGDAVCTPIFSPDSKSADALRLACPKASSCARALQEARMMPPSARQSYISSTLTYIGAKSALATEREHIIDALSKRLSSDTQPPAVPVGDPKTITALVQSLLHSSDAVIDASADAHIATALHQLAVDLASQSVSIYATAGEVREVEAARVRANNRLAQGVRRAGARWQRACRAREAEAAAR